MTNQEKHTKDGRSTYQLKLIITHSTDLHTNTTT
jgi:hypothetical protein